jgi:hypothetical protein
LSKLRKWSLFSLKTKTFFHPEPYFLGKGPGSGLFPPGDVDLVGSLSPLQRMASITNSLVSQPQMPGQGQMNRPNRAALPPITQQQFDRFSHLNTDEVVRRVSH